MNGVAVAAERADFKTVFFNKRLKIGKRLFVVKKNGGVGVRLSGKAAATDFYRLKSELFKILQSLFKRDIAQ